jgi:iron complex outermembrane receptor protein
MAVDRVNAAPNPGGIYAYNHFDGGTESYAAFGQASWRFHPEFTLTAGIRYSHDETDVLESARYVCFASALCPGSATALSTAPNPASQFGSFSADATTFVISLDPGGLPTSDPSIVPGSLVLNPNGNWQRRLRNDWSAVTGVVKLEWRPNNDLMLYASYTRGFKAGGFNAGSIAAVPTANEESVDAYEIGVKREFGRVFQINASLFYYNYFDPQAPLSVITASGIRRTDFINIPQTRNLGLELETIWSPVPEFQLLVNYALLDARITESGCYVDPNDPFARLPQASPGACPPVLDVNNNVTSQSQDLRGQQMPAAPLNRLTVNANYTFNFDPGNLTLSATWVYRSSTYFDIFNREYARAPAWTQTDIRATFTGRDNRYSIIAYGRNIFDQLGYEGMAAAGVNPANGIGRSPVLTPPRTYGVELQYRFF